jgi:hypothetical protein
MKDNIEQLGILLPGEVVIGLKHTQTIRGAESFNLIYELTIGDTDLGSRVKFIKEKCVVSFASPTLKAQDQFRRICILRENGVQVPQTFGLRGASIYQEFEIVDRSASVLYKLGEPNLAEESIQALQQLISIAQILDRLGFRPRDFIRDLIYGENKGFLYVDAGEDLGDWNPEMPNKLSEQQLLAVFPQHEGFIRRKYSLLG